MRKSTIQKLQCIKCHSEYNILKINKQEQDNIIGGLIQCKCSINPIIESILILNPQEKPNFEDINNHLMNSEYNRKELLMKIMMGLYGHVDESFENYQRRCFIPAEVYNYHKCRLATKSFFESAPFFSVLKGTILDVGCSTGLITKIIELYGNHVIGIENNIRPLYMAWKFHGIKDLINTSVEYGVPFKDQTVDFSICNDSFHYFAKQRNVAEELIRISESVILAHLHTPLETKYPGHPKHIHEYRELFPNSLIIPSSKVIQDYFDDTIDLTKQEYNTREKSVELVFSKKDIFKEHQITILNQNETRPNPLYSNGSITIPSKEFEEEHGINLPKPKNGYDELKLFIKVDSQIPI